MKGWGGGTVLYSSFLGGAERGGAPAPAHVDGGAVSSAATRPPPRRSGCCSGGACLRSRRFPCTALPWTRASSPVVCVPKELATGCTRIHPRCRSSCTVRPHRAWSAARRWRTIVGAASAPGFPHARCALVVGVAHFPPFDVGFSSAERTVDKDGGRTAWNLVPDPQARAQGLPDEGSGRLAPPRNRSKAKADEISFSWDFVSVVHIHLHGRVENASSPKKPEEFSSYAATRALPRGGAAARAAAHEAAPRLCATRPLARSPAGAQSALRRNSSSWS